MATHSSVLARRIPGTGEPGGLPSMGSHRVGHDSSDLAAAAAHKTCDTLQGWEVCFSFVVPHRLCIKTKSPNQAHFVNKIEPYENLGR